MHYPTDRIAHTTMFATPIREHWLEQEIAQLVHQDELIRPLQTSNNCTCFLVYDTVCLVDLSRQTIIVHLMFSGVQYSASS